MEEHASFNVVGKTAHFFAINKPLSLLVLLGVLGFGFLSFFLTPKQYNPEIVRPAFALSLSYIGATPDEAVDRVVYELVERVSGVPGVDEVITEVHDGARIGTTVIFDVGYDTTKAKVDLMSQLTSHSYLAQGFITQPDVLEINPETIPVLQMVWGSDRYSVNELRKKVIELSRQLTVIDEVSDVSIVGGYTPSLVVEVDPLRMSDAEVALNDVLLALKQGESRTVTEGSEGAEHTIQLIFDGRASSPDDIGALFVRDGVRVRDVAVVYEGATPSRSYVLYDTPEGERGEVVMLSVSKVEGSSAPVVTRQVREKIDALLSEDTYTGLSYRVVSDDGVTATNEINGLTVNLLQSIAIVAMVLILFLSIRSASIVLIAIPTTLLIVFGIGYLFGQTINRITLFALILSLGLLVDAAIVVVENMYVHIRRGSTNLVSATREIIIAGSVNEIGVGLFLSTITSVVVFLPVGYITGMMGPYMGPIAFFVPTALLVSTFVAIVIVPYVAVYMLHVDEKQTRLSAFVDRYTQRLIYAYKMLIQRVVSVRKIQRNILLAVGGLFLFVLIFPLVGLEHFQMLPRADRDQFYVYIDAPTDTALGMTKTIAEKISSTITDDVDVISVQQFVGVPPIVDFNGMFKGAQYRAGKNQATFRVNLRSSNERVRSSTDIVTDIRRTLTSGNSEYATMTRFIEEPPGPPVRATLVAKISSSDEDRTRHAVDALAPFIAGVAGVVDPHVSRDEPVGDITYTFDREKAISLGVSESDVMQVFSLYGNGIPVTEYRGDGISEYTPVMVTLGRESMDEPTDIHMLSVHDKRGERIPLTAVLAESHTVHKGTQYLERAERFTYITGEVEGRPIIYIVIDILKGLIRGEVNGYGVRDFGLFALTLEDSEGNPVTLTWGGEWEMTLENFRDLGIAMGVALVLVYAVLVAQYQSFKKPLFIMVTVPLGLIGILIGFLFLDNVFGIYLTATALIGFIALIGIVVNNAIIFSEYVDQEVSGGTPFLEALVEAGGARFRPIMLTSLTTILGSLTIAGDPVWSGLAWAIVFGLSLSTALTLVVYPTLLAYFRSEGEI